jgi:hypothetical protein
VTSQASAPAAGNTWPRLINALIGGADLTAGSTEWAMNSIMSGEATPVQVAGFLVALRAKGETVDEVAGLVEAMVANANPIDIAGEKLDIVGTGGDQQNTVNISTMAALICAGAAPKSSSTATGRRRRRRDLPMSWKPSASGWISPFPASRATPRRRGSRFVLPRCSTRRCGMPPSPAASSVFRRRSTSWAP